MIVNRFQQLLHRRRLLIVAVIFVFVVDYSRSASLIVDSDYRLTNSIYVRTNPSHMESSLKHSNLRKTANEMKMSLQLLCFETSEQKRTYCTKNLRFEVAPTLEDIRAPYRSEVLVNGFSFDIDAEGWVSLGVSPMAKKFGFNANYLNIVNWGERQYLLHTNDLLPFCEAVVRGREPRKSYAGEYYLAVSDIEKPVNGLPDFPPYYSVELTALIQCGLHGSLKSYEACVRLLRRIWLREEKTKPGGPVLGDFMNMFYRPMKYRSVGCASREDLNELFFPDELNSSSSWFSDYTLSGNIERLVGEYVRDQDSYTSRKTGKSFVVPPNMLRLYNEKDSSGFKLTWGKSTQLSKAIAYSVNESLPDDYSGKCSYFDDSSLVFLSNQKYNEKIALNVIEWGERTYLIPDEQILDFFLACLSGAEPRQDKMGFFFMKCAEPLITPKSKVKIPSYFTETLAILEQLASTGIPHEAVVDRLHILYWQRLKKGDTEVLRALNVISAYLDCNHNQARPLSPERNKLIDAMVGLRKRP